MLFWSGFRGAKANVLLISFMSDSKNVDFFHASSICPDVDDLLYCCAAPPQDLMPSFMLAKGFTG